MPRNVSNDLLAAMLDQATALITVWLLTLSHPELTTPLRFTNNGEDIIADGETFTAVDFEVTLPDDKEDGTPSAKIVFDNTDQQLTPTIRNLTGDFEVTLALARVTIAPAAEIEIEYLPMSLTDVQVTETTAEFQVGYENILGQEFPADIFSPVNFPGLF